MNYNKKLIVKVDLERRENRTAVLLGCEAQKL